MANESFAAGFVAPPRIERSALASIGFIALVLLVFLGFQPFQPPPSLASTGEGSVTRQFVSLGVFAIVLVTALRRRGLGAVRAMPFLLATM